MTRLLRSLLRVRFLWLPAVGAVFALAVVGAGRVLSVEGGILVVVAGFLVTTVMLAAGLLRSLWG